MERVSVRTAARAFGAMIFLAGAMGPGTLGAQTLEVVERTLDNGLQVLMVEKHDAPTIIGAVVYRVGAANERAGITGISHLFEHLMFKGSEVIGTRDFLRDREIMTRMEEVRREMAEEERLMRERFRRGEAADMYAPEARTPRYCELEKTFEDLARQEKETVVKDELSEIYNKHGAYFLNAFTTKDMTNYFVRLPKNKIELFLWMESDRMQNAVFREFYSERDVVLEERRMSLESTPTGRLEESFNAMFWESGPYGWDVVGWPSDLHSLTQEDAERYRELYYAPNNATLLFIGDFDPEDLFPQVREYFGGIPRGKEDPPDVVTLEVEQAGTKELTGEAETSPEAEVRFHTVAFQHPDSYPLTILAGVLSGKSGRLYKSLVLEKEIAIAGDAPGMMGARLHVDASQNSMKYGGYFSVSAEGKDGVDPTELRDSICEVLEDLGTNPVTEYELQKVKNQVLAADVKMLRRFQGIGLMFNLGTCAALGDYREVSARKDKLLAVTAEDVRRVAGKYFGRWERNDLLVYPKAAPEGEVRLDPEARRFLGMIQTLGDEAQLGRIIGMIEGRMAGTADEKERAQSGVLLEAAKKRLEEIKAEKGS